MLVILGLTVVAPVIADAADTRPPNIVLIIADDQTYTDFGFMGHRQVRTPNLDRLAAQSARYVNGYVPSSVCSPSLATILTGLYPHQHGIHYNHPPPGNAGFNRMKSAEEYIRVRSRSFALIRSVPTLPRLLGRHAGYRSLQTGKFWEGRFSNAGFDEGMTVFRAAPGQDFGGNRKLASGELVAHGNGDAGLAIGRESMQPIYDFIDRHSDVPFLVWYAPFLPHQPHDAPKRFFDLYENAPGVPEHCKPYYASISQFDETVGQLVRFVEHRGLARETIFVFVVDNGWEASTRRARNRPQEYDHTKRSKRAPFDVGVRTPILIRWDGRTKPASHHELVSSIDILPTLLSAAGLQGQARDLPGIDLLPSATGNAKLDPGRPVFGEIYPGDATTLRHPSRDIAYRWVRQGDLKLITVHSHDGRQPWGNYLPRDALFDLSRDADESRNLIDDAAYKTRTAQLLETLNQWWTPQEDNDLPKVPDPQSD